MSIVVKTNEWLVFGTAHARLRDANHVVDVLKDLLLVGIAVMELFPVKGVGLKDARGELDEVRFDSVLDVAVDNV